MDERARPACLLPLSLPFFVKMVMTWTPNNHNSDRPKNETSQKNAARFPLPPMPRKRGCNALARRPTPEKSNEIKKHQALKHTARCRSACTSAGAEEASPSLLAHLPVVRRT